MLYEKEERKLRGKIRRLILCRKIQKGDSIVIFGACENGKVVIRMLLERGFSIHRVVDNDPKKIGGYCSGIRVEKPEILKEWDKKTKVLFYTYYEEEISAQLKAYGMTQNRSFYSLFSRYKLERTALAQSCRILEGVWRFRRLKKKYGEGCVIFVCPYTGTGDIYLIGLLLGQFLENEKINDYVFVVVSTACRKAAQIYGIQNIEQMTKEKARALIKANMFAPDLFRLVVLNDSWASVYTNPTEWLRGYKGLNFADMFRIVVFQLGERFSLDIPVCRDDIAQTELFFEERRLKPGRTVILAPYSTTLSELPNLFWEEIARQLRDRGYAVCTNSCGPQEPPVKGTEAVFFPLDAAIPIVNMAGGFIGVRSGFCDIISSTKAVKVIIYEQDSYFYQGTTWEYFSLIKMGLCRDAIEVFYQKDINALMEQVLVNFG